jgi:hypothetical protein
MRTRLPPGGQRRTDRPVELVGDAARLVLDDKARARGSPYEASLDGRLTTREPPCRARLSRFGSFMNLARYLRTGFLCIELHFALTRALLSFILDTDVTFKH